MACPGSASPVGVNGYLSTRLNAPTIPLKEPFLVPVVQALQLTVGPLGACSRFVCEISSQKRQQINLSFGFIESRQLSGGGGKWVDGSSPQQRHGRTPEGTESFSVATKRPLSTTAVPGEAWCRLAQLSLRQLQERRGGTATDKGTHHFPVVRPHMDTCVTAAQLPTLVNPSSRRFNPNGHRMHLGCSPYMRTNPTRPTGPCNPNQPSSSTA